MMAGKETESGPKGTSGLAPDKGNFLTPGFPAWKLEVSTKFPGRFLCNTLFAKSFSDIVSIKFPSSFPISLIVSKFPSLIQETGNLFY